MDERCGARAGRPNSAAHRTIPTGPFEADQGPVGVNGDERRKGGRAARLRSWLAPLRMRRLGVAEELETENPGGSRTVHHVHVKQAWPTVSDGNLAAFRIPARDVSAGGYSYS